MYCTSYWLNRSGSSVLLLTQKFSFFVFCESLKLYQKSERWFWGLEDAESFGTKIKFLYFFFDRFFLGSNLAFFKIMGLAKNWYRWLAGTFLCRFRTWPKFIRKSNISSSKSTSKYREWRKKVEQTLSNTQYWLY